MRDALGSARWLDGLLARAARTRVAPALLGVALLISACGGGNSPPQQQSRPAAPALTVSATIKQLTFSWASVRGATSYRLLLNPDGHSGFTQVGSDLAADATRTTLDVAVHLHDWVNALYRLEACNAQGCSASVETSVVNAMAQAIGYFKASNSEANDEFGVSIAMSADGNTLAVGALGEASSATGVGGDQSNNGAPDAGAVYVFARAGTQWSQQAYVKASIPDQSDEFGWSLALSADGNTLAVGAPFEDSSARGIDGEQNDNGIPDSGAVYVFTRTGAQWSQQTYVKASFPAQNDKFGWSLALSADASTLAVGTIGEGSDASGVDGDETHDVAIHVGAAYVFTRAATQWSQQAYVKASNPEQFDNFGFSVALSADGNTMAVGARGEDSKALGVGGGAQIQADNSAPGSGAAYVFARIGTQWSQQAYVKASNTQMSASFGWSLALSADGNTLAVGANGEASGATGVGGDQNDVGAPSAGAVYVFTRAGTQWSQQGYVKASNTGTGDSFGSSLVLSADGNTLVAGARGEDSNATGVGGDQVDNNANDAGAVYVFKRSAALWSQQAYVKASNAQEFDSFGQSLAVSADGNTLAVGEDREDSNANGIGGNQNDNSAADAGAVQVF